MDFKDFSDEQLSAEITRLEAVPFNTDANGMWSQAKRDAVSALVPLVNERERRNREADRKRLADDAQKIAEARRAERERASNLRLMAKETGLSF